MTAGRRRKSCLRVRKRGGHDAPMRRCICGPRAPRGPPKKRRRMRRKPLETYSVDRLATPIGPALVVSDADGHLRAFDWEDHAARIRELLRLPYGAGELQEARMPASIKSALSAYFKGDLDALKTIEWHIAGTPFQQKIWKALPKIPAGKT